LKSITFSMTVSAVTASVLSGNFGAQLAHTDKPIRDKAVKSLSTYLLSNPSLSALALRKLNKGLFYCFWMSDRQHVQLHLASRLSNLVAALPVLQAIEYTRAWFHVLAREWPGLDRVRLNKYYMFMRKMYFKINNVLGMLRLSNDA
jgi:ribosomal RNA-processing protein 1